jgi:carboxyl-terminal processing protease
MIEHHERAAIIKSVRKLVADKLFHPWWSIKQIEDKAATIEVLAPDLQNASEDEFQEKLNAWLTEFGLSHMAFFHVSGRQVPPQFAIGAQLRGFANGEGYAWYVQHLAKGGAADQAGIRLGDAVVAINGRAIAPPEELRFQLGKSHDLMVRSPDGRKRIINLALANAKANDRPPMLMPEPLSDEVLEHGVGLIRIATFPGAIGFDFARKFDSIIAKFKALGCDRLIMDLRGNPGGGLGSLRVMSYLVSNRQPTGYSLTRLGRTKNLTMNSAPRIDRIPDRKIGLWLMALRFGLLHRDRTLGLWTESLGVQPFHGKTILLVDEFTRSAAEMIAGFASKATAAMIVGARTPGQVLGAANFKLAGDYRLRIPVTAWYMRDGEIIEGKGVVPDLLISPSLAELREGRDVQLEAAITAIGSESSFKVGAH